MPPIKTVAKNVCPLCEDITPLLYKYIICKSCHDHLQTETDSDTEEEIEKEQKEELKEKQQSH